MKRRTTLVAVLVLAMLAGPAVARAADPVVDIPPTLDPAIAKGLAFLAKQQQPDGGFEPTGNRVAITGLAVMAFLASGHVQDTGKYGLTVRQAIDFLVKSVPDDGYYGKLDGSRMYGQGIVTLALAEALGVETDAEKRKKLRAALEKAVKLILTAQAVAKAEPYAGGWRYEPQSGDSDLSVCGWNALALRAAQNVGMDVPKEAIQKAVSFVLKCYHKDAKGFAYQPGGGPNQGLTGVGVLTCYLMDAADRPELPIASKYLVDTPIVEATGFRYYYCYYATQAAYQAGDPTWSAVWRTTHQLLLNTQMPDGGWPPVPPHETSRAYATSMTVLTLSVPYRLLPIYQR